MMIKLFCVFGFLFMLLLSLNARGLRKEEKTSAVIFQSHFDILCVQETKWDCIKEAEIASKWEGEMFSSISSNTSGGVAVFLKKGLFHRSQLVHKDKEGKIIVIDFCKDNKKYRLINIHAPNIVSQRKQFFYDLRKLITINCIIIGDFNVFLTKADISSNCIFPEDTSRSIVFDIISNNSFVDLWRLFHPGKRQFTRKQIVLGSLKQSRIDLCLMSSSLVSEVSSCLIRENAWSDHSFLMVEMGRGIRNGGLWCLNAALLQDVIYRGKIGVLLETLTEEMDHTSNLLEWWDQAKQRIKNITIKYSKQKKWKELQHECNLRRQFNIELDLLENDKNKDITNYILIKKQLDQIEINKCRGAIIRSKARYLADGEKSTAFFLAQEKRNQIKSTINELIRYDGEKVTDITSILETIQSFYSRLFTSENIPEHKINEVVGVIQSSLSQDDTLCCDAPITEEEIQHAIDTLNQHKSPGNDGISAEFYKQFKTQISKILLKVFTVMEQTGCTPRTFAQGVITIVYKNKGNQNDLENYRPISLLNTDYKIYAKILANRLKEVVSSIISPSQAYGIPQRNISDTILSLNYTIKTMSDSQGILFSVDFSKAFDRVEHNFLWAVLNKFGFGQLFINRLQLLYANAESKVKCNGHFTDYFRLHRSIRQGCPLSSLLYSLVAEPIAILIKQDKNIQGITSPLGGVSKIFQFADDTTITVVNEDSLTLVLKHLHAYGSASGSKINTSKSEIMYCGGAARTLGRWDFRVVEDTVKVLGVYLGKQWRAARDETWKNIVIKVQRQLNLWKQRKLTLKGKIVIVNSLIISKIIHPLSVYDLPNYILTKLNSEISTFIWKSKRNLVAHKTLIAPYKEGGLKLADILSKKQAMRLKLITRFLTSSTKHVWYDHFQFWLSSFGTRNVFNLCSLSRPQHLPQTDQFYSECLAAWAKVRPCLTTAVKYRSLLLLPIFNNPEVVYEGRMLDFPSWRRAGIYTFGQILNDQGSVDINKIFTSFRNATIPLRQNIVRQNCHKIQAAIPFHWSSVIDRRGQNQLVQDDAPTFLLSIADQRQNIHSVTTKKWYCILISQILQKPAAHKQWIRMFLNQPVQHIWSNLHKNLTHQKANNTDFLIRHRRIFTGVILHQINKDVYGRECTVCLSGPETLEHLFLYCPNCTLFWDKIGKLLDDVSSSVRKDKHNWDWLRLFGLTQPHVNLNKHQYILCNVILSIARHSIYISRNYQLYEHKKVNRWKFFTGLMQEHLRTVNNINKDRCKEIFGPLLNRKYSIEWTL